MRRSKQSMYVNSLGKTLDSEYLRYFRKNPSARIVRSRGDNLVSKILTLDTNRSFIGSKPYGFCINDQCSSVEAISQLERDMVILDEGLIATYPTTSVLRHFKLVYNQVIDHDLQSAEFPDGSGKLQDFNVLSDQNEKVSPFVMVCFPCHADDIEMLIRKFTDEFIKYGYYMTSYDMQKTHEFDIVYMQFEAKYTNMLVELEEVLYHVSPVKNLKRILKNGFVPYDKASQFKYPPRVYFFNRCPSETVYDYAMHKTSEAGDSGFCVFKIVRDLLLKDPIFKDGKQRFYLDPAFSLSADSTDQTAVFTYQNVPLRCADDAFVIGKYVDGELQTNVLSLKKEGALGI